MQACGSAGGTSTQLRFVDLTKNENLDVHVTAQIILVDAMGIVHDRHSVCGYWVKKKKGGKSRNYLTSAWGHDRGDGDRMGVVRSLQRVTNEELNVVTG